MQFTLFKGLASAVVASTTLLAAIDAFVIIVCIPKTTQTERVRKQCMVEHVVKHG